MSTPLEILKKYWGYDSFRSLQSTVIDSVLDGKDTVALLHTGAGKSLCYQLPALVLPGKTVVISPLIALMQDQVKSLVDRGVVAQAIYAGMRHREVDIAIDNFVHGPTKILYVSPERAGTDIFIERFKRAEISLIAVDEAHCISQWGYDFRPSYFNIVELRKWHPKVPVIAVTATATAEVVDDIVDKLELQQANVITSTFARDNISLSVMICENKQKVLLDVLGKIKGVGIIYMRSRSKVRMLADWLTERGVPASYYHGGLPMKLRKKIQEQWQESSDGLIVCTNAFGMGVDKPNVRYVIHLDVAPSMEEYYQEAGRGGRDGKPAFAISMISHGDIMKLEYNIALSYPPIEEVAAVYQKLCSFLKVAYGSGLMESYAFDFEAFCDKHEINKSKCHSILNLLEKEGWIQFNEGYRSPSTMLLTSDRRSITMSSHNSDLKSKILVHIVRRYEGLFIEHTPIDEEKIAEQMGLDVKVIKRELQVMHREAILIYTPAIEGAKVTFLQPRLEPKVFSIDNKMYEFRKSRAVQRKEAMVSYVLSTECRQQQLLAYFDEESEVCGRCDICKGSADTSYTEEEKLSVRKHITKKLQSTVVNLEDYLLRWPYNKRAKAKACVLSLENEGLLTIDDQEIIRLRQTNPST